MFKRLTDYAKTRTGHLAATYLAIIMAMTVVFSVVIFSIAVGQMDRPLSPRQPGDGWNSMIGYGRSEIDSLLHKRAEEARMALAIGILALNAGMLAFGAWFSMFLARRTMAPIEQAMEEQARFVSDASHELRTPLTAIKAMNEVALRRSKITDVEARDLAKKNISEAAKLHDLASSLLGLVRVSGQVSPIRLKPANLQSLVGDALDSVVIQAQRRHIAVSNNVAPMTVLSDDVQLSQLLRILLDNAVKYSHAKGAVTIESKKQGDKVLLAITDRGIGIAADDIEHIFSRFYRADTSRNKEKRDGFGLGLSIAKDISDRLGLGLRAESELGKGSRFFIYLPIHSGDS